MNTIDRNNMKAPGEQAKGRTTTRQLLPQQKDEPGSRRQSEWGERYFWYGYSMIFTYFSETGAQIFFLSISISRLVVRISD